MDRVEVIKLPAHSGASTSTSNGSSRNPLAGLSPFSMDFPTVADDAPLNLSLKSNELSLGIASTSTATSGSSSLTTSASSDRISRRKPGPKPRRVIQSSTADHSSSPLPTLSPLSALYLAEQGQKDEASLEAEQQKAHELGRRLVKRLLEEQRTRENSELELKVIPSKSSRSSDGRPRNLGKGISKPKKNTVASLLAQSRALGIKPSVSATGHQVSLLKSNILSQQSDSGEGGHSPSARTSTPERSGLPNSSVDGMDLTTTLHYRGEGTDNAESQSKSHKEALSTNSDSKPVSRTSESGGAGGLVFSDDSSLPDVSSDSESEPPSDTDIASSGEDCASTTAQSEASVSKKRTAEVQNSGSFKRRRTLLDERELRVPLDHGWRRETVVRGVGRSGVIKGEVTYFSPCGRRFKQFQEVGKYLEKHGIANIGRENFTFSSKVLVGDFLQPMGGDDFIRLSESEVLRKLQELQALQRFNKQRISEEELFSRHIEARELARLAQEQRSQQQMAAKEAKRMAKEESLRQKEQMRIVKEQEKIERQEAMRRERELRAQQMMEEREIKRQQAVLLKEQAVQLYMQELTKQREILYTVELERERRRQHMLLVKALEARKRQEDRERKREEMKAEKRANRDRKMEQRRLEIELLREMRKPTEDMELSDQKPLPTLNRIPGLKLSGKAFADTLMVFEFLHNFGETLGFDMESLPSLNSLQLALLNEEEAEEELLSVMTHLLVCAIEDPGVPHPARHMTILGQSLRQADLTHTNLSEILRLYLHANAMGEVKAITGLYLERERDRDRKDSSPSKNAEFFAHLHANRTYKMSEWLRARPFLSLNPTHKASILAFLCNELLQNKAVCRQIENSIENLGSLRKDRWMLDGKVRKLKMLHARKFRQPVPAPQGKHEETSNSGAPSTPSATPTPHADDKTAPATPSDVAGTGDEKEMKKDEEEEDDKEDDEEEEEKDNESGNESEGTQGEDVPEEEEDRNLNADELLKKIDRLNKQYEMLRLDINGTAQQLRAVCLGQDRYWRRYWSLPCAGGIFLEGLESAELKDPDSVMEDSESSEETKNLDDDEEDDETEESKPCPLKIEREKPVEGGTKPEESENDVKTESKVAGVDDVEKSGLKSGDDVEHKVQINDTDCDDEPAIKKIKIENGVEESEIDRTKVEVQDEEEEDVLKMKDKVKEEINILKKVEEMVDSLKNNICDEKVRLVKEHDIIHHKDNVIDLNIFKKPGEELVVNGEKEGIETGRVNASEKGELVKSSADLLDLKKECVVKKDVSTATSASASPSLILVGQENALNTTSDGAKVVSTTNGGAVILLQPSENPLLMLNGAIGSAAKDLNGSLLKLDGSGSFGLSSTPSFGSPLLPPNDRPWFSLLPKSPCDESSVTRVSGCEATPLETGVSGAPRVELRVPVYPPPSPSPSPCPSFGSAADSPAAMFPPSQSTIELLQQIEEIKKRNDDAKQLPVPDEFRRGWWRITDVDQLKSLVEALHQRGIRERDMKRMMNKYWEFAVDNCGKGDQAATDLAITSMDQEISILPGGAPLPDDPESWSEEVALRVDMLMLEQVEALEDRVASASMQVKGWKVPNRVTSDESITFRPACIPPSGEDDDRVNPIVVAKERLLDLELAIERRYLKSPLGSSCSDLALPGLVNDMMNPDDLPKGLVVWREAVRKAETAAQLAMAFYMLEASVAWDRSIMKAVSASSELSNCQFCHSGDNEDKLLLCDGCDKGYHTYCFKPKMENIPDGDWYCYECINKATGERSCIVCGKKPGKALLLCEQCPRAYHIDCLQPPLAKAPRGKWSCPGCQTKQPPKKKSSSKKSKAGEPEAATSSTATPEEASAKADASSSSTPTGDASGKGSPVAKSASAAKKDRKKLIKDLNPCRLLLDELEVHDDAWPFLLPVNTKQFPTYRKIIKNPMDLSTIRKKLQDGGYKSREEFSVDVRIIFDNCETFNEDDSPVGKAGHSMRSYFESKWNEMFSH